MDGRRDNSGLGRRLHRPVARPYEPVGTTMLRSLAAVTVLVPSYDDGLAFFRDVLGFAVLEDTQLSPTKRWIVVAPSRGAGAALVLAISGDERQRARVPVSATKRGAGWLFSSLWGLLG